MSTGEKRYFQESDPRRRGGAAHDLPEFPGLDDGLPLGDRPGDVARFSRRGFLAALGLSASAFGSACSRSPVGHALPFNDKPEELTPGVPLHYASSCGGCPARCGVLVKTRDGRPIKLEGNDRHPHTRGGLCAAGQASVLSLYDAGRARGPSLGGRDARWPEIDAAVQDGLARARAASKAVFVVTPGDLGPTEEAALARFLEAHPTAKRVIHDVSGAGAVAESHEATHGARLVPAYRLDRASHVLGIEADFLGTWLSPVAFTRAYSAARDPGSGKMLVHHQVEPRLSLTGSNADLRFTARPSDTVPLLAALARALADGAPLPAGVAELRAPELPADRVARLVGALRAARGKALVLCGSLDPAAQALTNLVNSLLGAYGATIDPAGGARYPTGALQLEGLLDAVSRGEAGAVLFWGVNPAYDHPRGAELAALRANVDLTVSTAGRLDETASLVKVHAPDHDPLEAWGDVRSLGGIVGLRQPTVRPLFETRSAFESFLRWAGESATEEDYLRSRWESQVFPRVKGAPPSFVPFWDGALQDGFAELADEAEAQYVFHPEALASILASHPARGGAPAELELSLHEKVSLRDGRLANNAWLQELPDPISKVTWANYAVVSGALATETGVSEGDLVTLTAQGQSITLPVVVEPGVHPRVVAVAVGYGRTAAGSKGNGVGANAYPLGRTEAGRPRRDVPGVTIVRAAGHKDLARSQTHSSQEGRGIVREAMLGAPLPAAGHEAAGHDGKRRLSMWPGHAYPGPKWEMTVDLTACTGCSACVIACQAENNIPSVGELEVLRRREMHWIRIDRYFEGSADEPAVVHQPMMCQHCDNAPCETVCPVLATVHSSEGLNQQVYNRCVGTRYCANNCPPKVRRFNWFDYPHDDPLERMVLNPDVAVRSRGVMEKCSFCVQRIQEGKARAKAEGRPVRDGDLRTACEQSCPAGAIVFGNVNDPESRASKLSSDPRRYRVLEELNVGPAVGYLTKIRAEGAPGGRAPTEDHHG